METETQRKFNGMSDLVATGKLNKNGGKRNG